MGIANIRPIQLKHLLTHKGSSRLSFKSGRALGQIVWNLLLITSGGIICAICLNGIILPQNFMSGGFVGISLVLKQFLPGIPVAALYLLLNIPVFCLGWKYVGRRFFGYSIVGAIIFSVATAWSPISIPLPDKMLSAILAGLIMGAGSGLILKSYGSAGGMDILSVILLKKFSIRLGTSILVLNAVIIGSATWLFSLESALYTLIYFYVSTQVVNLVVNGLSQRKSVRIISKNWDEIRGAIMDSHRRGVTVVDCTGGYSDRKMRMLFAVIPFQDLSRLKQLIHRIDPEAFVVVSDTLEVMGNRIGNQPHW